MRDAVFDVVVVGDNYYSQHFSRHRVDSELEIYVILAIASSASPGKNTPTSLQPRELYLLRHT